MPSLGGWEFVILIGVLVLLFGAKRLPDMARSIGQSARVFKGEMKGMKSDEQPHTTTTTTTTTEQPKPSELPPAPTPPAATTPPSAPPTAQVAPPLEHRGPQTDTTP